MHPYCSCRQASNQRLVQNQPQRFRRPIVALADADVTVTIEFEAKLPKAATNHPIRPITENTRTLNVTPASGFERD